MHTIYSRPQNLRMLKLSKLAIQLAYYINLHMVFLILQILILAYDVFKAPAWVIPMYLLLFINVYQYVRSISNKQLFMNIDAPVSSIDFKNTSIGITIDNVLLNGVKVNQQQVTICLKIVDMKCGKELATLKNQFTANTWIRGYICAESDKYKPTLSNLQMYYVDSIYSK